MTRAVIVHRGAPFARLPSPTLPVDASAVVVNVTRAQVTEQLPEPSPRANLCLPYYHVNPSKTYFVIF